MKNNSFSLVLLANLFVSSAMAGTMGSVIQKPWTWVGSISAGPVWNNGGTTQTFYLDTNIEKTYTVENSNNVLFDGEVFLGLQKTLSQTMLGQLGIAVAATSNATLSGDIWDDANPQFNNYIYKYKIQNTRVAVKGKLLADAGYWLIPWVSGSIGVGFNDAHAFNNTPIIFEAVVNPNFTSHTKTTFTYTVGAGVQKPLTQNWQVGVGYEFADWGQSQLGKAVGQNLGNGLSLDHLYTNGVMFNLTYIA